MPIYTTNTNTSEMQPTSKPLPVGNKPQGGKPQVNDQVDRFETSTKTDSSKDGKFTWSQAFKNLGKGLISPITAIGEVFKSKTSFLLGAGMIGAGIAATIFSPATVPMMLVAGGLFGVYELGKGLVKFSSAAMNGDNDGMENAFKDIGAGITGTGLSLIGVKGSAVIAAEAKAFANAYAMGATDVEVVTQGLLAAEKAKSFSIFRSIGENFSMCAKGVSSVKAHRQATAFKNGVQGSLKDIQAIGKHDLTDADMLKIAKNVYDKDIAKIAQELSVPESELRALLSIDPVLNEGSGAARFIVKADGTLSIELDPALKSCPIPMSPDFIVEPNNPFLCNSSSTDVVVNYMAHEMGHLRSALYRIKHLSLDEVAGGMAYKICVEDLARSGNRNILLGAERRMLKVFEAPIFAPKQVGQRFGMCDDFLLTHHAPPINESIYDLVVKAAKNGEITRDIKVHGLRYFLKDNPDFMKINNFTSEAEAISALQETAIALQLRAAMHNSVQTSIYKNKPLVELLKRTAGAEADKVRANRSVAGLMETSEETLKMQLGPAISFSDQVPYLNTLEELSARSFSLLHRAENLSKDTTILVANLKRLRALEAQQHIDKLSLRLRFLKAEQAIEAARHNATPGTDVYNTYLRLSEVIINLEKQISNLMKLQAV